MVRTVDDARLEVHDLITAQDTVLRGFLNTLVDRLDEFLRDRAADGGVLEDITRAGLQGSRTPRYSDRTDRDHRSGGRSGLPHAGQPW